MFKKILVGTDFSIPSRAALSAAIDLARRAGSSVEVVHVLPEMEGRLYRAMLRYAEKRMRRFVPANLSPIQTRVLRGDSTTKVMIAYAKKHGFDLIALGNQGKTNLTSLLIGSVTQQLVRISNIPVMVVPPKKKRRKVDHKVLRIVVPTDFSVASRQAIDFGIRFAKFLGAELHFIHVENSKLAAKGVSKTGTNYLWKEVIPAKNQEFPAIILFGDPPDEIVKYAQRNHADLIVMGTHGAKGLRRILLGSVTASVLSRSSIPVIAIGAPSRRK